MYNFENFQISDKVKLSILNLANQGNSTIYVKLYQDCNENNYLCNYNLRIVVQ